MDKLLQHIAENFVVPQCERQALVLRDDVEAGTVANLLVLERPDGLFFCFTDVSLEAGLSKDVLFLVRLRQKQDVLNKFMDAFAQWWNENLEDLEKL